MRPKGPSKEARRASGECRRARRARTAEELARPEGLAGTSGAKRNWSSASIKYMHNYLWSQMLSEK